METSNSKIVFPEYQWTVLEYFTCEQLKNILSNKSLAKRIISNLYDVLIKTIDKTRHINDKPLISKDLILYLQDLIKNKSLSVYTSDDTIDNLKKITKFIKFNMYQNNSDNLINMCSIISDFNGKISTINAYKMVSGFDTKTKSESLLKGELLSCLHDSYQYVLYYQLMLIQQSLKNNNLCSLLTQDSSCEELINNIKNRHKSLAQVSNESVLKIIRNGFAHYKYVDYQGYVKEKSFFDDLNNTVTIMMTAKDKTGQYVALLSYNDISSLVNILIKKLSEVMGKKYTCINYNVSTKLEDYIKKNKYKFLINQTYKPIDPRVFVNRNEYLPWQNEYLDESCKAGKSFADALFNLKYPVFENILNCERVKNTIKHLSKNINSSSHNLDIAISTEKMINDIMTAYLFNDLTIINESKQRKKFVDYAIQTNQEVVNLLSDEDNIRRLPIANKLRLMRDSFAHGNVLNNFNSKYLYNVDRNKKQFVGRYNPSDINLLCDTMEMFIEEKLTNDVNNIPINLLEKNN